jgi:hypothetical protein
VIESRLVKRLFLLVGGSIADVVETLMLIVVGVVVVDQVCMLC